MGVNKQFSQDALAWIRFALNADTPMPEINDWQAVYAMLDKQKISGICAPFQYPVSIQRDILLRWFGELQMIKSQSLLLNKRTIELFSFLKKEGFRCCILKGQGNAMMYPDPMVRIPGDIDVWIDSDEKTILEYVKGRFPNAEVGFKHIKFPIFADVPVDVHYSPLKFYNPLLQNRLQRWVKCHKDLQFENRIRLSGCDGTIVVPTIRFNVVYQLGHIMTHLFDEGIGLRHFVDYYYVLKMLGDITEKEKEQICNDWKQLGLYRLASAVMWIEYEILGIPQKCLISGINPHFGKMVLQDTLEGGNFGKYSKRMQNHGWGRITKRTATFRRLLRFFPYYPGESFFRIISRLTQMIKIDWKKMINNG